MRGDLCEDTGRDVGRHHKDQCPYVFEHLCQRRGGFQRRRQCDAWQITGIFAGLVDLGCDFGLIGPQPDGLALLGENPCKRGSPRAGPYDRRRRHLSTSRSTASRSGFSSKRTGVWIRSGTSRAAWKETCPSGNDSCRETPSTSASAFSGSISSIFSTSGTMLELSYLP